MGLAFLTQPRSLPTSWRDVRIQAGIHTDILTHVGAGINFKGPQAGAWDPFCYSEYQAPQCPLRLNASS